MLLMHTCGAKGTVAVADAGGVRGEMRLGERKASEELMPAVRRLLEEVGWGVGELGALGVVRGPGSFTGVRTGWSVGKGICEALRIPLVGVSRLELLAREISRDGLVHAALDAGRGQFYCGRFQDEAMVWQGLAGVADLTGGGRWVACEAKVVEALREFGAEEVREPSAGDALGLVLEALARGVDDVLEDALYLRQTDAEIFAKADGQRAAGG